MYSVVMWLPAMSSVYYCVTVFQQIRTMTSIMSTLHVHAHFSENASGRHFKGTGIFAAVENAAFCHFILC